ncbi:hypothetical protein BC936DRAFT_139979 [Jimgerdemannia flammicorona]|uniref:Uncharacterized protein n=1 Tax=Jimgerdemannia flammicorona TaxID=994334 RepID=A0A433DH91_9FUNG|nr:hypothetical protein BC936DRAFT_139979 [Jimgerdemannia flammicorona]
MNPWPASSPVQRHDLVIRALARCANIHTFHDELEVHAGSSLYGITKKLRQLTPRSLQAHSRRVLIGTLNRLELRYGFQAARKATPFALARGHNLPCHQGICAYWLTTTIKVYFKQLPPPPIHIVFHNNPHTPTNFSSPLTNSHRSTLKKPPSSCTSASNAPRPRNSPPSLPLPTLQTSLSEILTAFEILLARFAITIEELEPRVACDQYPVGGNAWAAAHIRMGEQRILRLGVRIMRED